MLTVTIPAVELYDEVNNEFITIDERILSLEHSLASLSKWESKWCKPFLSKEKMTEEESLDYIRCMTITPDVPSEVYNFIPNSVIEEVSDYIAKPMTATWFSDKGKKGKKNSNEQITAEIIYYWMIALNIPPEYESWHLNKLLTLIRVCDEKNKPAKKRSNNSVLNEYAALNRARRQKLSSKG
jgi:hypothetical protein